MTRRRTWAALAVALLFASAAYAYDVVENVRARRELDASRTAMNAALDRVLETRAIDLFFAEDAPAFAQDLRASYADVLDFLAARLAWWRWNIGVRVRLPDDPRRDERLRVALSRADARCPVVALKVAKDLEVLLNDVDEDAHLHLYSDKVCGQLKWIAGLARGPRRGETNALGAWEWADRFAASAW